MMAPPVRPVAPQTMAELAELVVARGSAVEAQTALKNQFGTAESAFLKRQLDRRISRAGKDIAALDREILKRIKADASLARRYAVLTSIPSFGFAVAATLIACLAEIGSTTAKQIGMLAGLAPIADQSGDRQGIRVIWGGRPAVRRVLYLAALSASRFNADMKAFYKRLIDNSASEMGEGKRKAIPRRQRTGGSSAGWFANTDACVSFLLLICSIVAVNSSDEDICPLGEETEDQRHPQRMELIACTEQSARTPAAEQPH